MTHVRSSLRAAVALRGRGEATNVAAIRLRAFCSIVLLFGAAACSSFPRTPDGRPIALASKRFEMEDLPSRTAALTATPFRGMRLRVNGDRLVGAATFPSAGRYLFYVTGASSSEEQAGITLFV